jgi:flavin-dependent dehydrogenase
MQPDHSNTGASSSARRAPKILVVGGGPAGAACALELSRHTAAEVVIVDRSTYPRRKVCGSGLSPFALTQLEALDMLDELRPLHVDMRSMRVVGPGGLEITLGGKAPYRATSKGAWVVPRAALDNRLVQAAVRHGARLLEGTRVVELVRDANQIARGVRTPDAEIEADLVVVANGSPSTFEIDDQPREGIRTIMGWWQAELPDQRAVMIWDEKLGGYYAWAFPEPGGVTNIGLTIAQDHPRARKLRELFTELLHDHFADLARPQAQLERWAGHPATVTTRIGPIAETRTLFVGEAARLVCPATIEGISFALQSGRLAARTIGRSFDVARGLSNTARRRYRFDVAASMLPKFLAGEALYRVMRSPVLRRGVTRVIDPRKVVSGLTHFVGEHSEAA